MGILRGPLTAVPVSVRRMQGESFGCDANGCRVVTLKCTKEPGTSRSCAVVLSRMARQVAAQQKTGVFLYLSAFMHVMMRLECPYAAAACGQQQAAFRNQMRERHAPMPRRHTHTTICWSHRRQSGQTCSVVLLD